jgi:hypothetical protein
MKKYYFHVFSNENYFKKQSLSYFQTLFYLRWIKKHCCRPASKKKKKQKEEEEEFIMQHIVK